MGYDLRHITLGLLMMGAVTTFGGMFAADLAPNQQAVNQIQKINQTSQIAADAQQIERTIIKIDISSPLSWGNVVKLVIQIADTVTNLPGYLHTMITSFVNLLGLPSEIAYIPYIGLLIVVVFEVFSALNKYET